MISILFKVNSVKKAEEFKEAMRNALQESKCYIGNDKDVVIYRGDHNNEFFLEIGETNGKDLELKTKVSDIELRSILKKD